MRAAERCLSWTWTLLLVLVAGLLPTSRPALGQTGPEAADKKPAEVGKPGVPEPPAGKVEVQPQARDSEIGDRLVRILEATGWFRDPEVTVDEGVVFLRGHTDTEQYRKWAGDLARSTEGVVAVVNQIEVATPTVWDFTPVGDELRALGRGLILALPLLVWALFILALAWVGGKLASRFLRAGLRRRVSSHLLREVAARSLGVLVFLLGLYLVFRTTGLTRLAVTVLGGTGLVGLVLGIAFRDITENFLASIFLSLQHPFREGDLVEIGGTLGYVQRLTSRTTVLMTLDGNQLQIPNSMVFKSTLRNYTSSPNRREDFVVGVGYDTLIPHCQEVALKVLAEHPAVLKDPEPWVLVDSLGAATVNLRVYFWLDGTRHSWLKVRSSVIRLIKRAFQDAGISLPDEAREVTFPNGVPVRILEENAGQRDGRPGRAPPPASAPGPEAVSTTSEGGLRSEAKEIEQQARQAWLPEQGENLLRETAPKPVGPQK